jgi:hypothetical protein
MSALCQKQTSLSWRAFAEAVIRSVELIVQPDAKDPVGEMGLSGGLARGHGTRRAGPRRTCARNDAGGVELAKVHVKAFYFPSPVACTPEIYHPLRTEAQHSAGINLRITEGLGN